MRYGLKNKIKIQGQELLRHKLKNPMNAYIISMVDDNEKLRKNHHHETSINFQRYLLIRFT